MDTLFLYNTKTLKEKFKTKVFAGDNHITKINVQIPDNIGGYPKRECEFNLRAIIPEGNLSYIIEPSQPYFYVTNDITEKAQTVKLMMIITHEGNIIGRTNTVDLIVNEPAEVPDPPLTPRKEFDEVIEQQRETISTQQITIDNQSQQIERDTETISGLNTQVGELEADNTRLEAQHETDQRYIDYLIENPPEVRLQSKSVSPTSQMQVVEPDLGYQGLSSVSVGAVTPPRLQAKEVVPQRETQFIEPDNGYNGLSAVTVTGYKYINPDLQTWLAKGAVGDIEIEASVIKESLCYKQTGMTSCILTGNPTSIENAAFSGCTGLITFTIPSSVISVSGNAFNGCSSLITIIVEHGVQEIGADAFYNNASLTNVYLPNTLTSVHQWIFRSSNNIQIVVLENGFNCNNLVLSNSTLYSHDTILSWFNALADRTGETAYTLTIGTTNLNKMTAEEKAIATNKNWNLS